MGVVNTELAASGKLSFYDAAPVVKPAHADQAIVPTDAAALTSYGFTEAQANTLVATVNAMRAALIALGLIKGSA